MSSINEFKLVGTGYIAKNGDSVNDGTDPLLPKASPSDAGLPTGTVVVGSGYYQGVPVLRNYQGDGFVVFDGLGNSYPTLGSGNFIKNIYLKNFFNIVANNFGTGAQFCSFDDCVFQNITGQISTASNFGSGEGYKRCIFLPQSTPLKCFNSTGRTLIFNDTILLESVENAGLGIVEFRGCFTSKNTNFTYRGTSSNFIRNCINGTVTINSITYELKFLSDGSLRPDADPNIPDIATAPGFSDVYTTRLNFAGDPKFLDIIGRIVEPSSDLLKVGGITGNIGGVRPGRLTQARNNSDPNTTITLLNVVEAGNGYTVAPGENFGKITIVTRESTSVVELGIKSPIIPLNFDSDETPGTVLNNNVPDSFPLTDPGVNPGKLPNRLTYLLRTSQRNTIPSENSHWDNDAAAGGVAGTYYVQEWFTKPTLTQTLGVTYGNAEPEGYGGTVNPINTRWCEYTIYLRNDRNY